MDIIGASGFEPRTVDKVERLLDLLEEMERHPSLKGRLALHGGTAINLFLLDVPRLSVDIDVSYVGEISREGMLADRPRVEAGIEAVARAQGYIVEPLKGGHAGRTFLLRYRGDWGVDHVKVDCIYMNRSPILPLVMHDSPMRPGAMVRTFSQAELAGGKVKAFFDRVKVRDLYDVAKAVSRLRPGRYRASLFHEGTKGVPARKGVHDAHEKEDAAHARQGRAQPGRRGRDRRPQQVRLRCAPAPVRRGPRGV